MAKSIEDIRKAKREHMARRRAANPDAARAYGRACHQRNLEKNREKLRAYASRRFFWIRARKLKGLGRATTLQLAGLWKSQRGICALTGRRLDRSAQLDHITPASRGGDDTKENLRWVCCDANISKRAMTDEEFIRLCTDVVNHHRGPACGG